MVIVDGSVQDADSTLGRQEGVFRNALVLAAYRESGRRLTILLEVISGACRNWKGFRSSSLLLVPRPPGLPGGDDF